jgi:hypothetical protein
MFVNAWSVSILTVTVCLIHTFLMQVWIRLEARHKWHKNVRTYPYFKYPLYKKVLLLGLRGALPSTTVIINFSLLVCTLLCLVLGIWITISPIEIICIIFRVILGLWLLSHMCAIISIRSLSSMFE